MNTRSIIKRYELRLHEKNLVRMPKGAEVICIRPQPERAYWMWALVDAHQPAVEHQIRAYREDVEFDLGDWVYLASASKDTDVWHFFCDRSEGAVQLQADCEAALMHFGKYGTLLGIDVPAVHKDLGGHVRRYLEAYKALECATDRVRDAVRDSAKEQS